MEELSSFSRGMKEQRPLSAQSKYQNSRNFNASQSTSVKLKLPSHHASIMPTVSPTGPSPPSTPSPRDPFTQLDSTSTASMSHLAPHDSTSTASMSHLAPHDSTPTVSMSHLAPQNHASRHNVRQWHTSTESDVSSVSACHAASLHHKVPIDDFTLRRVSLEQHLQHGDTGREEAMQSFILERFLPAAKTVAADHDRTIYSAGKHRVAGMPSTIGHSSSFVSTWKAAPVHSKKSMKSPATSNARKSVAWSGPCPCDDRGDNESVNREMPAKSCGFFCAGLKSAMSRAHNIAHTSTHSMSRTKSRATRSSSIGTSSDEEDAPLKVKVMDAPSKVKVMLQDTQKQRGAFMPGLASSSSSPTTTIQDPFPARHLKKSFARGSSRPHSNSKPLLNFCIKCHTNSSLQQLSIQGPSHEHVHDSIPSQQSVQTSRWIRPNDDACLSCHCDDAKQTSGEGESIGKEHCLWNASNPNVSSQDPASQAGVQEILVHHNVSEIASRDRYYPEDEEVEFYDALSRFDMSTTTPSSIPSLRKCKSLKPQDALVKLSSDEHHLVETRHAYIMKEEILAFDADHNGHVEAPWREQSEMTGKESPTGLILTPAFALSRFDMSTSTPSSIPSLRKCKSSKPQDALLKLSSDEHQLVETRHAYIMKEEILAFDADHDGHVEAPWREQSEMTGKESPTGLILTPAFKHMSGSVSRCGNDVVAQPTKSAYSPSSNSCEMSTPKGRKKSSSSPGFGWPLGISSFQSGMAKDLAQETKIYGEGNTKIPFAKIAKEHGRDEGRSITNLNTTVTKDSSPREGTKHCNEYVSNTSFSLEVLSPPIPPSPTTNSWLGKALAMKASKLSYLATLQQEEKVVSAKKNLEFTSPLDEKKEVRWEDVVKGSQMH